MLKRMYYGVLFAGLLCPAPALAQQSSTSKGPAILEIIPHDCWAFVAVRNLHDLDSKLAEICTQLQVPPFSLSESLQTRINLGPTIEPDGSLAIVFMPADSLDNLGTQAVLLLPCDNVETLLKDFPHELTDHKLWRAELVWGSTYVAHKKGFAILGTAPQAVLNVLRSTSAQQQRFTGALLNDYNAHDINVWLGAKDLFGSAALKDWLHGPSPSSNEQTIFGADSTLFQPRRMLEQLQSAYFGVHMNRARLKCSARISPQPNTQLSNLLAWGKSSKMNPLALLPDVPFVLAVGGEFSSAQKETASAELHTLLSSEAISSATVPAKLQALLSTLGKLIARSFAGSVGVAALPASPRGLAAVLAVLRVDDAPGWLSDLRSAAALLQDGLFRDPESNIIYEDVKYESGTDSIEGTAVDHLTLTLISGDPPQATRGVDYAAAFGPRIKHVQLCAVGPHHVAICVGGYPRDMAGVLRASNSPSIGLHQRPGSQHTASFLAAEPHAIVYFSPDELVRMGRALARAQDRVEEFSYRMNPVDVPAVAGLRTQGAALHVEIAVPTELVKGIQQAYLQEQGAAREFEAPPSGN